MASNQGNQGQSGGRSGSRRGFASMDDEQQRRIAQKGGEASARAQGRNANGQFTGSSGGRGGSSQSGGNRGSNTQGRSR